MQFVQMTARTLPSVEGLGCQLPPAPKFALLAQDALPRECRKGVVDLPVKLVVGSVPGEGAEGVLDPTAEVFMQRDQFGQA
jgi:hypothetical protein